MKTGPRVIMISLCGLIVIGCTLFWPAATFEYWQAWVFIAAFALATIAPTIYLARNNPATLQRRMKAGPRAETRTVQKFIVTGAFLALFTMMALSAVDHRFGWSKVPTTVCIIGDALVVIGLCLGMLAVIQNSYAAATVRVEEDQTLTSAGLYKLMRHPMYTGNVILMTGIPLALGSYWGLLILLPGTLVMVCRILDEEKMLTQELTGYSDYKRRVRYRLVPYVW